MEKRRQLSAKANPNADALHQPVFVWEPVPDACKSSEFSNCVEALKYVDVISPNLEELESLLGTKITKDPGQPDIEKLDGKCRELLNPGSGAKARAVIVRMGGLGARVIQMNRSANIDAYHRPLSAMKTEEERLTWRNKVVDPTGAGNAFLGGFCIGLLNDKLFANMTRFERGAVYGSVAASFAVEQVGTPALTPARLGRTEQWNGEYVHDRMKSYEKETENGQLFTNVKEKASSSG